MAGRLLPSRGCVQPIEYRLGALQVAVELQVAVAAAQAVAIAVLLVLVQLALGVRVPDVAHAPVRLDDIVVYVVGVVVIGLAHPQQLIVRVAHSDAQQSLVVVAVGGRVVPLMVQRQAALYLREQGVGEAVVVARAAAAAACAARYVQGAADAARMKRFRGSIPRSKQTNEEQTMKTIAISRCFCVLYKIYTGLDKLIFPS